MPRKKKETLVHLDMDELAKTTPVIPENVSAQTLGDILKKARQKKRWDIEDVSKVSCIKPMYIEALEEGHYYVFPAKAYIVGFLRTYAKMLKLNPEEMITLYHQESSDDKEEPMDMLVLEKKATLPSKKVLALIVLVLLLFYILWFLIANSYSQNALIQSSNDQIQESISETSNATEQGNLLSEEDSIQQSSEAPIVEDKNLKGKSTEKEVRPVDDAVYTAPIAFLATERVWVRIKNNQKNITLLDKVMAKNEHFIPQIPLENLSISTARGGVLDLYINGIRTQTLKKEDNTPLIELTKD